MQSHGPQQCSANLQYNSGKTELVDLHSNLLTGKEPAQGLPGQNIRDEGLLVFGDSFDFICLGDR